MTSLIMIFPLNELSYLENVAFGILESIIIQVI